MESLIISKIKFLVSYCFVLFLFSCEPPPVQSTVTDIDGNVYNTLTFGTQTWMLENLKTTRYQNGDLIGTTTPADMDITSELTPKYQWAYNGNENNVSTYGRLYTWYAVNDPRKIAPVGWRVATDNDWTILENYLIAHGNNYDGTNTGNKIAKSMATKTLWDASIVDGSIGLNPTANNHSLFSGVPAGQRHSLTLVNSPLFNSLGTIARWWTSTDSTSVYVKNRSLMWEKNTDLVSGSAQRNEGFSVRCVRE